MALLDSLRSLTASKRPLTWDCSNKQKLYAAAFELHEVAMHAGFSPDEATTLSLTLAELATRAARSSNAGKASVFLRRDGWRVEVPGADVPTALVTTLGGHAKVRVVAGVGGGVAVAEYDRVA